MSQSSIWQWKPVSVSDSVLSWCWRAFCDVLWNEIEIHSGWKMVENYTSWSGILWVCWKVSCWRMFIYSQVNNFRIIFEALWNFVSNDFLQNSYLSQNLFSQLTIRKTFPVHDQNTWHWMMIFAINCCFRLLVVGF